MTNELARNDEPEIDERIERIVWRGLGIKSARQIAEEAGISPETVLRVKRELLESVDVLSIQERRMKIMADLQELAQEARRRYEGASDEFAAGLLNSSVAAWKAMITELARMEKADTSKVESLNAKRVQELVRLVRLTVDASVYELSDRFDLDSDDLFEVFNRNMAIAAEQLEAE